MERLAVLGEIAATIAHEVRNPLTGVRSLAQRIAQDEIPADKRRKYADVILEETRRVERLVSNLLELARRGTRRDQHASTTTALPALFEDLALLVASRAERARVQLVTNAQELVVPAPREAVAQALLNLLLNAIAHSPPNSVVTLNAQQKNGSVEISVRDHGQGIAASERERVFDPFYTTTATGTGLGLSVVRHLAREHEWQVSITDTPGGGTQFTIAIASPAP
jgi:two-component system sensor histidine kinase AtoS